MSPGMITNVLCVTIFAASYYAFQRPDIMAKYLHFPYRETRYKEYIRVLSSGFLHGSWNHLLINLFVLYQFGIFVESYFFQRFGSPKGAIYYVAFFLTSIVLANMGTFIKHQSNPHFRSLGASGVTSSMVMVYVLFNPWQMFIFPPVPAFIFAIIYLGYSTWASRHGRDNIDHQGHLWGALYGVFFIWVLDPPVIQYFIKSLLDIPWLK